MPNMLNVSDEEQALIDDPSDDVLLGDVKLSRRLFVSDAGPKQKKLDQIKPVLTKLNKSALGKIFHFSAVDEHNYFNEEEDKVGPLEVSIACKKSDLSEDEIDTILRYMSGGLISYQLDNFSNDTRLHLAVPIHNRRSVDHIEIKDASKLSELLNTMRGGYIATFEETEASKDMFRLLKNNDRDGLKKRATLMTANEQLRYDEIVRLEKVMKEAGITIEKPAPCIMPTNYSAEPPSLDSEKVLSQIAAARNAASGQSGGYSGRSGRR